MYLVLIKKFIVDKLIPFLWEFRWLFLSIVLFLVIIFYKGQYESEVEAHNKTKVDNVLSVEKLKSKSIQDVADAKQKTIDDYKLLVEKSNKIQERYLDRDQKINNSVTTLNSANGRLSESIRTYINASGSKESNITDANRLSTIGGLLETCESEQDYFAKEASKLGNSVLTLQEWGDLIIKDNSEVKDE